MTLLVKNVKNNGNTPISQADSRLAGIPWHAIHSNDRKCHCQRHSTGGNRVDCYGEGHVPTAIIPFR